MTFDSLYGLIVRLYEIVFTLAGRKFLGARCAREPSQCCAEAAA